MGGETDHDHGALAHLIRDVRFLVEHPHTRNQAYGKRVLAELRELLAIIHRRDTYKTEQPFRGALEDQRYHAWTRATYHVPPNKEAQNLANRFRGHGHD